MKKIETGLTIPALTQILNGDLAAKKVTEDSVSNWIYGRRSIPPVIKAKIDYIIVKREEVLKHISAWTRKNEG